MCFSLHAWMCVHACVCLGVLVCVGGNGLICLCILTMFIRAAAAALMRNTFRLILLPHATEMGVGGLLGYNPCLFSTHNIWTGLPSLLTALWLHPQGNNFFLKHISFAIFSPSVHTFMAFSSTKDWDFEKHCWPVTFVNSRVRCSLDRETMEVLMLTSMFVPCLDFICLSVKFKKTTLKNWLQSSLTLLSLLPAAEELNSVF